MKRAMQELLDVGKCHVTNTKTNYQQMKLKLTIFAFSIVLGINAVNAQTVTDGFAKLNQKDYQGAKQIFSSLVKANPKNAVALFGMGEYYYFTGIMDSAKINYLAGVDANSSYANNYAGLGKISLLSSPAQADAYFKDAIKKSKKDASALVIIANAYYSQVPKKFDDAKRYLTMALETDPSNANAYYLNGLIEFDKNNIGDASRLFETAIHFDKNLFDAYFRQSEIMIGARNFPQAIEYINKVVAINPNYWLAYKTLGELYYDYQKYVDAITNFAIYFKNVFDDKDITHYAYSLFFNKQYQQARDLIDKLVQQNPNEYVYLRLLGYISYETKDLVNGKSIMDKFFALIPPDKIMTDDYSYYGKMLSAVGNDSLAIQYYKLALKKDSTQFQIFDELAKSSTKLKKYDESLKYGSLFLKKKPNLTSADYYNLGRSYYSIAGTLDVKKDSLSKNGVKVNPVSNSNTKSDSIKRLSYYHEADSLFAKVEQYSPTSYLGSFWRARVNSAIDSETTLGLAKPFYEKALELLIKDPVKFKKQLTEIYAYLGFYYYVKEDKPASIDCWKKLLEIDPENQNAQETIKSLEKK